MIRWVILAVLIVGISAGATLVVQSMPADVVSPTPESPGRDPDAGPPPKLEILDELTHDFGTMSEQDEGTHAWTVRNVGEGTLRVRYVNSPCTCTSVRVARPGDSSPRPLEKGDRFALEPGEEAGLSVTWETREAHEHEDFSTYARFITNDLEEAPQFDLEVEGNVYPAVVVLPTAGVEFASVPTTEEATRTAFIFSPSMPEMELVGEPRSGRPEHLVAEFHEAAAEELEEAGITGMDSGYELRVTLRPGMPLGTFSDAIVLGTDHPIRPELEVPVRGEVIGPISATPERLYLPNISSREGGEQSVILTVRGRDRTEFTDIRLPASLRDVVEVSIEPTDRAPQDAEIRQYRMTVRVPRGARPGNYGGTITLETDHPDARQVKVPIQTLFIRSG